MLPLRLKGKAIKMSYLYSAFGWIMNLCYKIVPNYFVAIFLLALIIKIILFPLGIKQQKNMQKQASLRPKEMAIRKRYAGRNDKATQQKMQQDIMELYQKENYSMFGGCLPLVIQFPIIIALYNVIRNPLTYLLNLGEYVEPIAKRITELFADAKIAAEIDMFQYLKADFSKFSDILPADFTQDMLPSFSIGNFDFSLTPSISKMSWLIIIPIATYVISLLSMKLTRKFSYQAPQNNVGADGAVSMKLMDYTMPLLSVWITFSVPAIIGVYWIFQNILSTVQQFVLSKIYKIPTFTEEEYKQAEKEMNGSIKKAKKNKPKSLHNDDDDDDIQEKSSSEIKEKKSSDVPVMKEDRTGKKPGLKSGEKKNIRSLHHIDDEDYEN